jgi:hypothetical protein
MFFFIYFSTFYFYFGIIKIYQKYTKNSKYTISKFSIPRPLKTNQNCIFWYGNIPTGNPAAKATGNSCASGHCKHNGATCYTKAKAK